MSFLPLSYSTTSLSTTHSACFTEASDSTSYTSEGRWGSNCCVEGSSSGGGGGSGMQKFLLGPGWRDHRVPPAERLKHLYRLLEEHYDLTGGDYYGQGTLHPYGTANNCREDTQEGYSILCTPYLESIGAGLDFLDNLNDMSPDPMNDLINEAFSRSASPSTTPRYRVAPISTWEIDWSRPLPEAARAYWETMRITRPRPHHEFVGAKPAVGGPRANPQIYVRQKDFPQYYDVGENVRGTSKTLRAVLHKVRGLVTSH